jgi:transketolase
MVYKAGEGHIPSAFSIVDIVDTVYAVKAPEDRFILSKGHGCAALYVVLAKHGILTQKDLDEYGTYKGKLGGHPDRTKVPGVECSTGSLGHGLPQSVGLALGQNISGYRGKVICLVGDGECHEGTTWEAAIVAYNLRLDNLILIIDDNKSAAQICPHPDLRRQFWAFGWEVRSSSGHAPQHIARELLKPQRGPVVLICSTVKGMGVRMLEGHGKWHHKIPNAEEYAQIMDAL